MFGIRFWALSVLFSGGAALLLGIPTVLIVNHWFIRMTPTSPQDYIIWILSALLIGPVAALALLYPMKQDIQKAGGGRAMLGTFLSFLSVGCPVCNKVVVFLLGFSGAMTFFNPLRPFLGIASVVLLATTLFLRVRVLRFGCPVDLGTVVTAIVDKQER
jgi:predicted membrane protein